MTHTLTITLADAADLAWAQATVTAAHYLHAPVDPRARPMAYIIRDAGQTAPAAPQGVRVGLVMLGIPHATRCQSWWGGAWRLPAPQWGWQDLTDIAPRTMRLF